MGPLIPLFWTSGDKSLGFNIPIVASENKSLLCTVFHLGYQIRISTRASNKQTIAEVDLRGQ